MIDRYTESWGKWGTGVPPDWERKFFGFPSAHVAFRVCWDDTSQRRIDMGQAFDEGGEVIAEAFGRTKREVLDKLEAQAPNADAIVISRMDALRKKLTAKSDETRPEGPSNNTPVEEFRLLLHGDAPMMTVRAHRAVVTQVGVLEFWMEGRLLMAFAPGDWKRFGNVKNAPTEAHPVTFNPHFSTQGSGGAKRIEGE